MVQEDECVGAVEPEKLLIGIDEPMGSCGKPEVGWWS